MEKLKALFKLICLVVPLAQIRISAVRIFDLILRFRSKYCVKNFLMAVCLTASLFSGVTVCRAQKVAVEADPFTGTATVGVPLHTVRNGDVVMPISLVYVGTGLKVKSSDGSAGLGWNIVAGGEIRRELRDLPDDVHMDGYANGLQRLGWLYNSNGNKIAAFNPANDNNPATCTDEQADVSYINTNFGDLSDTEPDIFSVNAPGLSCRLVFDMDHVLRPVPYQDLKISYELDTDWGSIYASDGRIKSFTIVNDRGMKYVFSDQELCLKTSKTSSDPNNIKYFKRQFDQYKNGIYYNSAWKLTTVYDANDNYISLAYNWSGLDYSNTRVALASGNSTVAEYPFSFQIRSDHGMLDKIYYNDHEGLTLLTKNFSFKYKRPNKNGFATSTCIDSIKGFGQTIVFDYSVVNKRASLNGVVSNTGLSLVFDYYKNRDNKLFVPDSTSMSVDAWGYYNGSNASTLFPNLYINPSNPAMERYRYNVAGAGSSSFSISLTGSDRYVNADSIQIGSLSKITYEHGGNTSLVYESNDYYDPTAATVVKGGGLRLKQVIDSDGTGTNDAVRAWSYINPATGVSSGKAVSLPVLAFTVPYNGGGSLEQQWQNSTVRMEESLSPEEHYIGYSHVRRSQGLSGSVLNEYSLPATQWDTGILEWTPTIVRTGRPDCNPAGLMNAEKYGYPFVPNPNFDFERGLLLRSTAFNSTNEKLSETVYTYQRSGSPLITQAFRYDMNNGAMSYARYPVLSSSGKLLVTEDRKEYDLGSGQFKQTVMNTAYESPNHKLPTLQTTVNTDGSIQRSRTLYIKDYPVNGSGDQNALALYRLKVRNANLPVESYSQLERNGVNKTFASQLTLFKPHTAGEKTDMNVASQELVFSSINGISDFVPSSVTSGTSVRDSRYRLARTFLVHDSKGIALSVEGRSKDIQTSVNDYNLNRPVVLVNNARADEMAFNDFDTPDLDVGFQQGPSVAPLSADARTGLASLSIGPGNYLQKLLRKNRAAANYTLSLWAKGNSDLVFTISDNTSLSHSYTLHVVSSQWKYYQMQVPVADMAADFTAKMQTAGNLLVDDILFLPSQASVTTFSYDQATANKLSETGTNGVSTFFTYDSKGGLKTVLDQDKNIRLNRITGSAFEMSKFAVKIQTGDYVPGATTYNTPVFLSCESLWQANDGAQYSWNFGDGTPLYNTYDLNGGVYHQFTAAGSYHVTLTKNSPLFGTLTADTILNFTDGMGSGEGVKVGASNLGGTNGTITGIKFYKDGVYMGGFNQSELTAGTATIPQGWYQATIEVDGYINSSSHPFGYQRLIYAVSYTNNTFPFINCIYRKAGTAMVKTYQLSLDLNGRKFLSLSLDTENCQLIEQ
jgi:hypothetical protein